MNILEQWRDVPGYEGYYQVSDRGRVRSCDRIVKLLGLSDRYLGGKIISFWFGRYCSVKLRRDSVQKTFRVHALVMLAFVGNRPKGYEINHKNGIKTDNRLENLEYCTPAQNMQHAIAHGLFCPSIQFLGETNSRSKFKSADIPIIRLRIANGECDRGIARDYVIDPSAIRYIRLGRTWKHVP